MGILERKLREKEERRDFILLKTKELILNRGIDNLNMQDIADGVELSKATLYLYFQNKEALLKAILHDSLSTFIEQVRQGILPNSTGLEAIHALWSGYLVFSGEAEDLFLLTGICSYVDPSLPLVAGDVEGPVERPLQPMIDLIADLLRRGIADGTVKASIDTDRTAGIVLMTATSIINQIARLPRNARDGQGVRLVLRDTFEILLRGVASRDADEALLTLPCA
jgi:TetR/AcrR family transcriptional regulator